MARREDIQGNIIGYRNSYPAIPDSFQYADIINAITQIIANNHAQHEKDIADIEIGEIDGDKLNIDFVPSNYTRDIPPEADNIKDLSSHLKGISDKFGSGVPPLAHASTHISTDLVDGDKLDITWVPTNYTRDITPPEVDTVVQLTAHLKGIDDKFVGAAGGDLGGNYPNPTVTDDSHNHSASTLTGIVKSGDTAGGDLSGTYPDPSVTDDSHAHSASTLSGIVKSGDTAGGDLSGTYPDPSVSDDSHNHSASTLSGIVKSGDTAGGDLSGTYPDPSVTDDSHNHSATTLSGIVKSGDSAGGDLGGTYPDPTVTDDSHNHSATTLSGIVKSGDTAGGDLGGTYPDPTVNDNSHAHDQTTVTVTHASTTSQSANDHHNEDHQARHTTSGQDLIDGDILDITYVPTNYTRDTTPSEVTSVTQLTAHLAGLGNTASAFLPEYIFDLNSKNNVTNPLYQIDISSGKCRSDDNTTNFITLSTITVDITVSGVNGLDTGSEAISTWYAIYIIYNPTTTTYASLLSLSFTSPTLPSGYTKKRRVGEIYNNSSGNFRLINQQGSRNCREIRYRADEATTLLLISGGTASAYADVNCTTLVPPGSTNATFRFLATSKDGKFRTKGVTNDMVYLPSGVMAYRELGLDSNRYIEYQNIGTGGSIDISLITYFTKV